LWLMAHGDVWLPFRLPTLVPPLADRWLVVRAAVWAIWAATAARRGCTPSRISASCCAGAPTMTSIRSQVADLAVAFVLLGTRFLCDADADVALPLNVRNRRLLRRPAWYDRLPCRAHDPGGAGAGGVGGRTGTAHRVLVAALSANGHLAIPMGRHRQFRTRILKR